METFASFKNDMSDKLLTPTVLAAAVGGSIGYQAGGRGLKFGLISGVGMAVFSTAFFGTVHVLKGYRESDDFINYAVSGGINACWLTAGFSKSPRSAGIALVAGAAIGSGYKVIEEEVFDYLRQKWITRRVDTVLYSKYKQVEIVKPKFQESDLKTKPDREARLQKIRENLEKQARNRQTYVESNAEPFPEPTHEVSGGVEGGEGAGIDQDHHQLSEQEQHQQELRQWWKWW